MKQIVAGETLALTTAGHHAGRFKIDYVSLNDTEPGSEKESPGAAEANADTATNTTNTVAYLGDFSSSATAVSLPRLNAAGILQVSPASPYVGLVSSLYAGQDEPDRFYPSGNRTFARLQPGDPSQAKAQIGLMRSLGIRRVYVLDNQDPFNVPLATMVAVEAARADITVAEHDSLSTTSGSVYSGEIARIVASGAEAVFLAGDGGIGTARLWNELNRADPHLLLLGANSMLEGPFVSELDSLAASHCYLTSPLLAPASYPPSAQRVFAEYRHRSRATPSVYVLYGYEAMNVVLAAVHDAGANGDSRPAVVASFFAAKHRDGVLGRYSIEPDGETTFKRYGVDRIQGDQAVFYRSVGL